MRLRSRVVPFVASLSAVACQAPCLVPSLPHRMVFQLMELGAMAIRLLGSQGTRVSPAHLTATGVSHACPAA